MDVIDLTEDTKNDVVELVRAPPSLERSETVCLPKKNVRFVPPRIGTPVPVEAVEVHARKDWVATWPIQSVAESLCGHDLSELQQLRIVERQIQLFNNHVDFHIYGRERGSGDIPYRHVQSAFRLKKKMRFSAVKNLLPDQVHIEPMRGTWTQNVEYCSKEGDFDFYGEQPDDDNGQRESNRWKRARENAASGNFEEVDDQIYVQYFRNIIGIRAYATHDTSTLEKPTGWWIYGVPGSGKSHKARNEFGGSVYLKGANKWWDGYQDQENVVIEDLDKSHDWMANLLKCWMDIYPFSAEIKGGVMQIRPKRIICTSNYSLEDIFGSNPVDVLALRRRCTVEYFPYKYGEVPPTPQPTVATHLEDVFGVLPSGFGCVEPRKNQE